MVIYLQTVLQNHRLTDDDPEAIFYIFSRRQMMADMMALYFR